MIVPGSTVGPTSSAVSAPQLASRVRRLGGTGVVAIQALLPGGARCESIPGQAYMSGRMLAEGTRQRDFRQLAEELEERGMILSTAGSWETHGLALDALAGDWRRALDWTVEILLQPAHAVDRVDWLRSQTEAEIESLADRPEVRCGWAFNQQLYSTHPRGRRLQGDVASLQRVDAAACATFHLQALQAGVVLAVAGDIDEAAAVAHLEEVWGSAVEARGFEAGDGTEVVSALSSPAEVTEAGAGRRQVTLSGTDQAHLLLGHLTVPRSHPDFTALELLAVILGAGSGLTGRIPMRVREQEGLAYTATAQTVSGAGLDPGHLLFYVATSPDTVAQAEICVREELARLLADGVTPAEFDQARSYLLGREPFRRETAGQWVRLLSEAQIYGHPVDDPAWRQDNLRALSVAVVNEVAHRHLDPARLSTVVGLPGSVQDRGGG